MELGHYSAKDAELHEPGERLDGEDSPGHGPLGGGGKAFARR